MEFPELHRWQLTPAEAIKLQSALAGQVVVDNRLPPHLTRIAGVDVSCRLHSKLFHAAVVVCSYPEFEVLETATASLQVDFPYIPGLLSFRELPVILQALQELSTLPDLFLVDGQGIAHPRGLGLASHLGLWLELPTIGCAKSRLYGEHGEIGENKGDWTGLLRRTIPIGRVLRSRDRVKPLYVSPGHMIDQVRAAEVVLTCCTRYRLPEPIRAAHRASNQQRVLVETGSSGR